MRSSRLARLVGVAASAMALGLASPSEAAPPDKQNLSSRDAS
jgi:hypothetical protein